MNLDTSLTSMLLHHPFFEGFTEEQLSKLSSCAFTEEFKQGDLLIEEGKEADKFYLLRMGDIALTTYIPTQGQVTIQTLHAGDILGWSWLYPPFVWHFSGLAQVPVFAIGFDAECVRELAWEDEPFGLQLMHHFGQIMLRRLQNARRQMLDVYRPGSVQLGRKG